MQFKRLPNNYVFISIVLHVKNYVILMENIKFIFMSILNNVQVQMFKMNIT